MNICHFSPIENWMNDPNGLVYYENEYHLFYQHNPNDLVWGPMHWGHAVSTDMLNWEHLPIALFPDEIGTIFSGSAVVDTNDSSGLFNGKSGLVAFFTHDKPDGQVQSIAYSKDNGRTWTKYKNNPVILNNGVHDFRDPKVIWHEETKKWIAVFACKDRVKFYSSHNLLEWNYISEFGNIEELNNGVWECPDLLELCVDKNKNIKKWVLKIDVGNGAYAGGSGGLYFIGNFDGTNFINEHSNNKFFWLDCCKDFYAAQSWSNIPINQNRNIWIAWMNNWQYPNQIPANSYRGTMTIPREFELKTYNDEIYLIQNPIKEIKNMRTTIFKDIDISLSSAKNINIPENIKSIEIIAEVELSDFEIRLSYSENEFTIIGYNSKDNKLYLDRSNSGKIDFNDNFSGIFEGLLTPIDSKIKLHILTDINSIECFANDGILAMTSLIFPSQNINSININFNNKDKFKNNNILKSLEVYSISKI